MKIIHRWGGGIKGNRSPLGIVGRSLRKQVPRILPWNRYYGDASYLGWRGEGWRCLQATPHPHGILWAAISAAWCEGQHKMLWPYVCHWDIPCCLMVSLYRVCLEMKSLTSGSSTVQTQFWKQDYSKSDPRTFSGSHGDKLAEIVSPLPSS